MDDRQYRRGRRSGHIWGGLFLLTVGGVLLLDQMGFPFPNWLFHWPILLMALGVFVGIRCGFRGGMWLMAILVGAAFLYKDLYNVDVERFIWPGLIILIGLGMIFGRRRQARFHEMYERRRQARQQWRNMAEQAREKFSHSSTTFNYSQEPYSTEDYVDTTAIFSGVNRKIVSKNFKGGDVTSFMGGTELDLTQADFTGTVRLDVTQVFGGTKLLVPPHWEVRAEVTALFAGFDDKRQQPAVINPEKVLIISGTSIFGGIDLRNF